MTKQELDAMKLRIAELFKSFLALRATMLAKKKPQTIDDLIRAATEFDIAQARFKKHFDEMKSAKVNHYKDVTQSKLQELKGAYILLNNSILKLEQYEEFLTDIVDENPQKMYVQNIIQLKIEEKKIMNSFETTILEVELEFRQAQHRNNINSYWEPKIMPRIAALEVTDKDVAIMRIIENNLNEWIMCYESTRKKYPQLAISYQNEATMIINNILPAIQAKLKETQDAFTRSEEKRADLKNPPAMPEPDGTYLNNQQTPNTAPFHLPIDANGMNPSDIKQGQIDDCTIMSSMGALAKVNPQLLQKMSDGRDRITQLANGDFEVIVYARNPKTSKLEESKQIVSNQFYIDGSGKLLYADSSSELWTMLYEKALAQVRGGYDGLEFTDSGEMIALLTGKESTRLATAGKTTLNDIEIFIQNAVNQNQAILVTSKVDAKNLSIQDNLVVKLADKHAYWLESYNAAKKSFKLIDPRNSTAPFPFVGTIQDLVDYFDFITVN